MKIQAHYDPSTGNITDTAGAQWFIGTGVPFEVAETASGGGAASMSATDRLIEKGATADDLIKLRKAGVI